MQRLTAGLASILLASSLTANGIVPFDNHYLSYELSIGNNSLIKNKNVVLWDQFIGQNTPLTYNLVRAKWLLNPITKRHNGAVSGDYLRPVHYTGYLINPTSNPAQNFDYTVDVYNQFGSFVLNAFTPEYLLVPSFKNRVPVVTTGNGPTSPLTFASEVERFEWEAQQTILDEHNHYLCYKTNVISASGQNGFLRDQFRSRPFNELHTAHLCNPVNKSHDGRTFPIVDSEKHLMCFDLGVKASFKSPVLLANQFGRGYATTFIDDEICVPTSKVPRPPEGDLCQGSLTRPPNNVNGTCNGTCPTLGNICVPLAQTGTCHCVVGPTE